MAEWINPLQEQEEPTWGDTLSNLSITAKRMVAGLGALGRHLGEDSESAFVRSLAAISRWVEEEASESAQREYEELTPAYRERLEAGLTDPMFWSNPLGVLGAKAVQMGPYVATAIPAAVLVSNPVVATIGTALLDGTINAGQALDNVYQIVEQTPYEELLKIDKFRELVDQGMTEEQAREEYSRILRDDDVALATVFAIGAAASAIGAPGIAARALTGGAATGAATRLGSAGIAAGTGAVGGAAQTSAEDVFTQRAQVRGGMQDDVNYQKAAEAGIEGGLVGGVIGGVVGGALHRAPGGEFVRKEPVFDVPKPGREAGVTSEVTPKAATPEPATQAPRGKKTVTTAEKAVRVDPGQPDPAQAAALATEQPSAPSAAEPAQGVPGPQPVQQPAPAPEPAPAPQPTRAVPDEVVAASERLQQPAAPQPTQPIPTRPTQPQGVPQPVAEASQRLPQPGPEPVPTGPDIEAARAADIAERMRRREAAPEPVTPPREPQPVRSPEVPQQEGPRVLRAIDEQSKEVERQTAAYNRAASREFNRLEKLDEKREKGPQGEKDTKRAAKRLSDDEKAAEIVGRHAPENDRVPTTRADIDALGQRVASMIAEATNEGITIPTKVTEKTPVHLALLREASDLLKSYNNGKRPSLARAQEFIVRERAARQGDVEFIRSSRKVEGDVKARTTQGEVEKKTAEAPEKEDVPAGFEQLRAEHQDMPAKAPKSATSGVRGIEEHVEEREVRTKSGKTTKVEAAQAASEVRKVEVTDELRAKYESLLAPKTEAPKVGSKGEEIKAKATKKAEEKATKSEPQKEKAEAAPKIGPKGEAIKAKAKAKTTEERVAEAAKAVERKPTESQKAAGNYPKGHVSIHGLKITIETPKGGVRSGVTPDGTPWSVRMPAHYGYVRSTRGADGDHVDVYIGPAPDSDFVVVIDQMHLGGGFDEHKVMMGFSTVRAALETYADSFSDRRGQERIGDARVMSIDEFKRWLDNPASTRQPVGEHVTSEGNILPVEGPSGWEDAETAGSEVPEFPVTRIRVVGPYGSAFAFTRGTARLVLDRFVDPDAAPDTLSRFINHQIIKKLKQAVGDIDVLVVDDTDLKRIHNNQYVLGHYDRNEHRVVLSDAVFAVRPEFRTHVIVHELVHAATIRALGENPEVRGYAELLYSHFDTYFRYSPLRDFGYDYDATVGQLYGLTNVYEFIAEAMSNPMFQGILKQVELDDVMIKRLKLEQWHRATTWDALVDIVRRILGLPRKTYTALEAAMSVTERLMHKYLPEDADVFAKRVAQEDLRQNAENFIRFRKQKSGDDDIHPLIADAFDNVRRTVRNRPELQEQVGGPLLLKLRTMDQIAQVAKDYFGPNNPVRKVADLVEIIRVQAERNLRQSEPVINRLAHLERKYRGQQWEDFVSLMHDETMTGAFADRPLDQQPHLGKDALWGKWAKARHPELARRYAALPEDLKQARKELLQFYADQHNAQILARIENGVLKALGIEDKELAKRIHEGRTTEADRERLGEFYDIIVETKELAKLKGPYVPLMRRGDFVVTGRYKVTVPKNGELVQGTDNVISFRSRDEAIAFAEAQDTRPDIKSVWVDKNTGSRFFPDGTPVHKQDFDAEQRFWVTVQNRHVEFFATEREARAAAAEYEKQGMIVDGVEMRRRELTTDPRFVSRGMQTLLKVLQNREGFKELPPRQQNELIQALSEASVHLLGTQSIHSRRRPRGYIEGASKDLVKNTHDYAQASAGYLARLQHQPKLDAALKEMDEAVRSDQYSKAHSLGRSAIANEIKRRLDQPHMNPFDENGTWNAITKRVMSTSFISHLMSPMYSVVDFTQVGMVAYPNLAAKFGPGRAARTLLRAYNDIGTGKLIKSGIKNTFRKARAPETNTDTIFSDLRARVANDRERALLDYLAERGTIDPDAGLEISRLIQSQQGITAQTDKVIGYFEGIARQMPRVVETINRATTALAAYRMMYERTRDHQASVQYAHEVTNLTQSIYANTNQPGIFSHPIGRLTFQFMKYPQLVYGMIGHHIGKAIRNTNPGDRAEALKALGYLAVTHSVMAGVLGLPTEPFKYMVMGANAAGLTDMSWSDVEDWVRREAASVFGANVGEMLTRGVTRGLPFGLSFDFSSRVGLQNLTTFGEPRSGDESDVKAWLFDTIAGAPGGMVYDMTRGVNDFVSGEFTQAAQHLVPIKIVKDAVRAYVRSTEGKVSEAGHQTLAPYTITEALIRTFGATPGREAEANEARGTFWRQYNRSIEQRNDWMVRWAKATPSERIRLWGQIEKWNKNRHASERIKRTDLENFRRRRERDERRGMVVQGIRLNQRNREIFEQVQETYNF